MSTCTPPGRARARPEQVYAELRRRRADPGDRARRCRVPNRIGQILILVLHAARTAGGGNDLPLAWHAIADGGARRGAGDGGPAAGRDRPRRRTRRARLDRRGPHCRPVALLLPRRDPARRVAGAVAGRADPARGRPGGRQRAHWSTATICAWSWADHPPDARSRPPSCTACECSAASWPRPPASVSLASSASAGRDHPDLRARRRRGLARHDRAARTSSTRPAFRTARRWCCGPPAG